MEEVSESWRLKWVAAEQRAEGSETNFQSLWKFVNDQWDGAPTRNATFDRHDCSTPAPSTSDPGFNHPGPSPMDVDERDSGIPATPIPPTSPSPEPRRDDVMAAHVEDPTPTAPDLGTAVPPPPPAESALVGYTPSPTASHHSPENQPSDVATAINASFAVGGILHQLVHQPHNP